ncbi:MAG: hypothetical protein IJE14_04195 [Clostridia bacterium]|nr:hypothetical protein [Clostridia bacterium]
MKTYKRILAVILCVVMTLTAAPLSGFVGLELPSQFNFKAEAATIASYNQGDIIEFGWYPQSKVTDTSTISVLNSAGGEWTSYGYYSGTGTWNDGKMTAGDYMRYKDVIYGSDKYRGVVFDTYRPYCTGDKTTSSDSYSYQGDNGYTPGTVYWFKYEPVEWRVLDPDKGIVMSETIIDAQAYNNYILYSGSDEYGYGAYWGDSSKTYYANNYAESSIRQWLNKDFYTTAFSIAQQNIIEYTQLDNSAFSDSYSAYDSQTTNDKIYLLSWDDALNAYYGFSSSYSAYDTERRAQGSDYAKCQGLYVATSDGYRGKSYWWFRTPGSGSTLACHVDGYGFLSSGYSVNYSSGIRPALNFNLSSGIFQSDVKDTGSSSAGGTGTIVPDSFTYTQSHTVNNYKTANATYAAKYFAGAAQPMDGTNGTPDLCIPGLSLGENMVPQGIAYYPAKNWLLVSSYYKDAETDSYPCYIYALDFTTGKMVAEYKLKEAESSTLHGHVGGIAVSNHNLYVTTDDSCIGYAPLSDLDKMNGEIIIREHTSMSEWLGNANTAYLSINDGILITGNFFYAKDSKYDTPAKAANSVILMQRLNGNSSVDEWNSVCNPAVTAVIKVSDSIDRIQGVVYRDKKFYISSSFGRKNESKLYVADLSGSTLKNISAFKALPMMEDITFVGDYIYSVFESASAFYQKGLDGKNVSLYPTDVVWRIAYKELIYNMGDETYSFDNYSDDDSRGHCFGMSMTSAGYFLDILDINAIGGNKQDGIFALPENSKVKEPVCYYQNIQAKYAQNAIVAGGWYYKNGFPFISYDWNDVVNYVDNHEYDNKGTLQIGYRQGKSGHAINFLRYEVVNGQERIYAYDNNFPDTEVYFYKAENGDILQAPYATFDGAIDCIALRSVEKYFNSLSDYDATRYIFADENDISIPGAIKYPLDCGADKERVVFEIPDGEEKVVIVPLVENAEFEYLNVTYNFDQAEAGQAGEFTLAQDETAPEETVELTFIDFPQNIEIKTPSTTTVNYGETLILHADFGEVTLPEGYTILWTVEGAGFDMAPATDGLTCKMTSVANGTATVKATIVDENGEAVLDADGNEMSDSKQLTSKAGFWQKFVSFFKNLFGISRVILQSI